MVRMLAIFAFAVTVATSAQALPSVPLHQPDGMITQVAQGCGAGRVRINGVCVPRGYGYYGYRNRPYAYGYRRYGYYGVRPYRGYWAGRAIRRGYWARRRW